MLFVELTASSSAHIPQPKPTTHEGEEAEDGAVQTKAPLPQTLVRIPLQDVRAQEGTEDEASAVK